MDTGMSSDPLINQKLGDYVIVDVLGHGGMARVYKGIDRKLNRYAAVKVIDASLIPSVDQDEYRLRFTNEARAIARLNHPNIVGIYQFDQVGSIYYMAMQFIDGRDLKSIIRTYAENKSYLPYTDVLRIIRDIASALDYSHAEGVIHRDIKPSNVMVTSSGRAVLTDFGLALSVPEGTIGNTFGSAHYIAPEQAVSSAQAVPQSDLYSLGVCLFEMLTNQVPFTDQNVMAVALKHLNDTPPTPSQFRKEVTLKVDQVVGQSLNKTPNRRFATGQALTRALEFALAYDNPQVAEARLLENWDNPARSEGSAIAPPPLAPLSLSDSHLKPPTRSSKPRPPGSTNPLPPSLDDPTITDSKKSAVTRDSILSATSTVLGNQQERRLPMPIWLIALIAVGIVALVGLLASGVLTGGVDATPTAVALQASATSLLASATELPPTSSVTTEPTAIESNPTAIEPNPTALEPDPTALIPEPTALPTETRTPSRTPLPLTAAPTEAVTSGPVSAAPTVDSDAPVMLYWDSEQLTLMNQSRSVVNVSGLSFIQILPSGTAVSFESRNWGGGTSPPEALRSGACYQVFSDQTGVSDPPALCRSRHAFFQVPRQRWFWISSDPEAAFRVERDGEVLAECRIADGQCAINEGVAVN
jgi:serine/threonine protein kinase